MTSFDRFLDISLASGRALGYLKQMQKTNADHVDYVGVENAGFAFALAA